MSKGGAGKVYFVLYLAVILELLIIFIERDEAEENLRKQQQQAIRIVQTILSQLQTGQGVSGITTTLKDNIVLDTKDPDKQNRTYAVFVAVGDPKAESKIGNKTVRGDDVAKLEYIVSHIADPKRPENELGPDSADIDADKNVDTRIYQAELGTDVGSMTVPTERFNLGGVPVADSKRDSVFIFNEELTKAQTDKGRRVKVFTVNFNPNKGEGWYRLRFYSETNKILGVTGDPKDGDTIRIGNIKLTVKQLREVQKAMHKAGKQDETGQRVQKYIDQLLAPDAYRKLPENQGFTSFNVRVERPDLPPPAEPFASIASPRDTIYWLEGAPFQVQVTIGPKEGQKSVANAELAKLDDSRNLYLATISSPQEGTLALTAHASNGGKVATDEKYLVVTKPVLRAQKIGKDGVPISSGIDAWRGLSAVYGSVYDPSSDWNNPQIPGDHYQTVVTIKGVEVLNKAGVSFKNMSQDMQKALTIADGTKAEDIVTKVFWKPGATADQSKWILLLCNQENSGARFALERRRMTVGYRRPELITDQADFFVQFNPKNKSWTSPNFGAIQKIGNQEYGVTVNATCAECGKYGLDLTVDQVDDRTYRLKLDVQGDFNRLLKQQKELTGKRFDIDLTLIGRGEPKQDGMSITVSVAPR